MQGMGGVRKLSLGAHGNAEAAEGLLAALRSVGNNPWGIHRLGPGGSGETPPRCCDVDPPYPTAPVSGGAGLGEIMRR
ncbi:hypothetical protein QYE76_009848 [Lolium multiflorum]|uniref:Uncharacterized protein n=1 Tax=Lolium multiflorum TaxID=4521 RepID=A0AAD8QGH8_LOLMU|nr:hypothetical protein QYE76_016538 [Lolium multiflorum]KAK1693151.1 hypothetical protein QYE76_009848 [Lolium multiflorum]